MESVEEEFTLRGRTNSYRYHYPGDAYRYWIVQHVLNRCRAEGKKSGDDRCLPDERVNAAWLNMSIRQPFGRS
jgi:hypothetical protein